MERKKASDYPQELLNLFDRYVHGEIDRRNFLEGAKKYAVGGVTATAIWEGLRQRQHQGVSGAAGERHGKAAGCAGGA